MSYSLIRPQIKPFFSLFSKIWIYFIGIVFVLLLFLNFFLIIKNYSLKSSIEDAKISYLNTTKDIEKVDEIIAELNKQTKEAGEIFASNTILKQSLNNLFDLVPDSITLNEIFMDKNTLIVKGITPSKDMYNMLLASPLHSIFTTSNTSFYQLENGWFNFISTNKIDNTEGYNE